MKDHDTRPRSAGSNAYRFVLKGRNDRCFAQIHACERAASTLRAVFSDIGMKRNSRESAFTADCGCSGIRGTAECAGGASAGRDNLWHRNSLPTGTEIRVVNRLAKRFAAKNKKIITLDDTGCFARRCTSACSTRLGDFRLLRAKMRNVEIFYGSPKDRATFARKPASYRLTSRGFPEL
jgi:hypothetical protein